MIIATKNDKATVVDILTQAFIENKSVNYIIQHEKSVKEIEALMEYSFDICLLFGKVLLSDEHNACALILYPQRKTVNYRSIWLDIKLIFNSIGLFRVKTALSREAKIKAFHPKLPITYLWFIGVLPNYQHQGIGTQLVWEIIRLSETEGMPIFLETSTSENLPWYRNLGFEVYQTLDLTYSLYFLRR
ncbi:GNAT family N-acetyltransferase [Mucilaginibacter sp. R-33]|uniref:GNAT family N-acetyltransferase n=1 Tax=Mucilaginibacter sp. R-33 TaxID=3416711 RepID=UPI003CED7BF4